MPGCSSRPDTNKTAFAPFITCGFYDLLQRHGDQCRDHLRLAPDGKETPTGDLLFPGRNLLKRALNMSTKRATCPRAQSWRRASSLPLEQPARWRNRKG